MLTHNLRLKNAKLSNANRRQLPFLGSSIFCVTVLDRTTNTDKDRFRAAYGRPPNHNGFAAATVARDPAQLAASIADRQRPA
jgi:hypothetical protein